MAKKQTPAQLKAELEAEQELAKEFANPDVVAMKAEPPKPAKKADSGMRLVSLVPPITFPAFELPDGAGGTVHITTKPRLVAVAVANALLAHAKRPGNEFGLTPDNVRIEDAE